MPIVADRLSAGTQRGRTMEYAIIDHQISETPESRSSKGLNTVQDALRNLLHTESRGAYLMHYDKDALSAIITAIEASTDTRSEAQTYYLSLNRPIIFHLITFEKRDKTELDMIQKLIDMPPMRIHEAVRMLSV